MVHSCLSPPIGGDRAKILQANRLVFKKMGGKFGGDVPPNWGGYLMFSQQWNHSRSPPTHKNCLFGGLEGKIREIPPKRWRLEGTNDRISPPNLVGIALLLTFPATLQGYPPQISESGGDIDLQANLWGTLGGDAFCVGGDILGVCPPQLGGK